MEEDKAKRHNVASDILQSVVKDNISDFISFQEIKNSLHQKGFSLLMLFFALPLSIPLPVPPGLTTLPAIPLLIFSLQMILGHDSPWMPSWLGKKSIKRKTLAFMIEKTNPYIIKVETFMRPRMYFFSSNLGKKISACFTFIFAISIANPIPLSNMVPSLGIVLISFGLLCRDGLLIILGIIIGILGVLFSLAVIGGAAVFFSKYT